MSEYLQGAGSRLLMDRRGDRRAEGTPGCARRRSHGRPQQTGLAGSRTEDILQPALCRGPEKIGFHSSAATYAQILEAPAAHEYRRRKLILAMGIPCPIGCGTLAVHVPLPRRSESLVDSLSRPRPAMEGQPQQPRSGLRSGNLSASAGGKRRARLGGMGGRTRSLDGIASPRLKCRRSRSVLNQIAREGFNIRLDTETGLRR